jgi:hypothetical protein
LWLLMLTPWDPFLKGRFVNHPSVFLQTEYQYFHFHLS